MAKTEIIKRPVEKIGSALKKAAWMSVLESLAMMILGVLLIAWPGVVIKVIAYVVGAFFIIKGGYGIVNYFIVKGKNDFFNNDLLWGVIAVLVGIAVLVMGEEIANVFRIVVGVWMIYEALVRMNTSIKMSAVGISSWRYVLLISLAILLLGAFVTFNNGAVTVLIGWMMIIVGVVGIVGDVMFMQHVNNIVEKIGGNVVDEK